MTKQRNKLLFFFLGWKGDFAAVHRSWDFLIASSRDPSSVVKVKELACTAKTLFNLKQRKKIPSYELA